MGDPRSWAIRVSRTHARANTGPNVLVEGARAEPRKTKVERPGGPLHGSSRSGHATRSGLAPAMTGNRAESREFGLSVDSGDHEHAVHDQFHLTPAPSVRAMVASSDRATVKRARIAFTTPPQWFDCLRRSRQPGGLPAKIPGFASPSHDGFALDGARHGSAHRF